MSYYEQLKRFLKQANDKKDLKSKSYKQTYNDLSVKASFGAGNFAEIPWIAFLAEGQSVSNGIYPVYLYYKEYNLLILAYGISETNVANSQWGEQAMMTIGDYFTKHGLGTPKRYKSSYVYKDYPNISQTTIGSSFDEDLHKLIEIYKEVLNDRPIRVNKIEQAHNHIFSPERDMVTRIYKAVSDSGLLYSNELINRFTLSLLTKPFVILSGLSGSGKTQLALAFAKIMSENPDKQICVVPVGADWTNREPLLGYPNALREETYVMPESGTLQLIMDANKDEERPYFLILDEMNLSYVERYFSDFLSALESHQPIPLWKTNDESDVPQNICLPKNLFIIGTINVDETTYMFSPKVLDRANVIEFKIDEDEMMKFLKNTPIVNIDSVAGQVSDIASDFVKLAKSKIIFDFNPVNDILIKFFSELKKVNAEFGYRSATEIGRFIALAEKNASFTEDQAVDAAIVQKLLPKLHGSRKKLVPVLKALWEQCQTGVELENAEIIPETTSYPLTAEKILRMYHGAVDNGFTSFSEA